MGQIGAERLLARLRGEGVTPQMVDVGFTILPVAVYKNIAIIYIVTIYIITIYITAIYITTIYRAVG